MARKVYVSRHDLTPCPGCGRHARLDREAPHEARCAFCGESLMAAPGPTALSKLADMGRQGLVASSLLGATLLAGPGCVSDAPAYGVPPTEDTADDAADATDATEDATDTQSMALYGLPADTAAEDTAADDTADIEDAADAGFEPEYGIPPDATP